jgi:hypothetical protein
MWFLTVKNKIRQSENKNVVISDVRFPNEIKFIKDNGGLLVRINRGQLPVWYETSLMANNGNSLAKEAMTKTYSSAHYSEWAWVGAKVDFELNNDGTLDFLKNQVTEIMKTFRS